MIPVPISIPISFSEYYSVSNSVCDYDPGSDSDSDPFHVLGGKVGREGGGVELGYLS